eukprot:GGOE01057360.1.p1 GENE.GGOE01057360.1~~GGOE01057360.1.p1  ORF type:complete len:148 (-),score=12.62 GGOE01057360.1:11-454(-)
MSWGKKEEWFGAIETRQDLFCHLESGPKGGQGSVKAEGEREKIIIAVNPASVQGYQNKRSRTVGGMVGELGWRGLCCTRRILSGMVASSRSGCGCRRLNVWGAANRMASHCCVTYCCSQQVRLPNPRRWLSTSHRTAQEGCTWRWKY